MIAEKSTEILRRLLAGHSLDGLGLRTVNGRLDLGGLWIPDPSVGKPAHFPFADASVLEGQIVVKGVTWESLDFGASRMNGLRFTSSIIRNCIFDGGQFRDWRVWGTTFSDCSFRKADLRESALGGILNGQLNSFRNVDFTEADMRQTSFVAAAFIGCTFNNTKLSKVNFNGSMFSSCRFSGELTEVCFNRNAFGHEELPPNEMIDVDFSEAKLRFVEFRGLDLMSVRFPIDKDHIVLDNYPAKLDYLIQILNEHTDRDSKKLAAYLGFKRKWAGPRQRRGVLNVNDLLEAAGAEGLRKVVEILGL